MAKQTFGVKATAGVNYDLDKMKADSRSNSALEISAQVWKWNPNNTGSQHKSSNPKKPPVGAFWLSTKTTEDIPDDTTDDVTE